MLRCLASAHAPFTIELFAVECFARSPKLPKLSGTRLLLARRLLAPASVNRPSRGLRTPNVPTGFGNDSHRRSLTACTTTTRGARLPPRVLLRRPVPYPCGYSVETRGLAARGRVDTLAPIEPDERLSTHPALRGSDPTQEHRLAIRTPGSYRDQVVPADTKKRRGAPRPDQAMLSEYG